MLDTDVVIAALARNAARHRTLGVSLADGFASRSPSGGADLASFDKRVRRAFDPASLRLSPTLTG